MPVIIKKLTTLTTVFLAFLIIAFGLSLIVISNDLEFFKSYPSLQATTRELGALLFVTASISMVWELFVKRSFLQEVVELVHLSQNIQQSGVSRITKNSYHAVPWDELFADTTEFDMIVSYARTWREMHRTQLRELSSNPKCRIRVVLADPNSQPLISELSRRYAISESDIVALIKEAIQNFTDYLGRGSATFELYLSNRACLYTYYRFNDSLVVSFTANHHAKTDRPCLLLEQSGSLTTFFRDDFEKFIQPLTPQLIKTTPEIERSGTNARG
jgi:hypothetical protein